MERPILYVYLTGDDDDQEVARGDEKDNEKEGGDDEQEYDEEEYDEETKDEESFDPILKTPKNSDDKGNGEEDLGLKVGREEGTLKRKRKMNFTKTSTLIKEGQSSPVSSQFVTSMLNPTLDVGMELIFETTSQINVQTPTSMAPLPMIAPTMTPSTITTITTTSQAPILPTPAPSTIIQNLPNFGSLFGFYNRLRTLEANFSEFMQTNQFAGAISAILEITIDENMQNLIKEQVKEQVKVQVSKILPRIEQTVNEQLEAKVLTRSSHSSKTSYVVAADLSEMELKKILIEKMKGNKSIQRTDEQRNLYKALVEAYESDKIILDTYGETVTLKRRRDDDADKDEEPSTGPDRGRRQASLLLQRSLCRPPFRWKSPHIQSLTQKPPSLDRDWNKTVPATHGSIQLWISELAKLSESCSSFNELMDTPLDFSNFLINRLKVDTLTPELLAGPTYELMKGSCKSLVELEYHLEEVFKATRDQLDWVNPKSQQYPHNLLKPLQLIPNNRGHRVIPFEHFINNDLEYLRGGASSRKYPTSITKMKVADYGHIKWIEDLVPRTMWIEEPICYDKHALSRVSHWGRKHRDGTLTDVRTALDDRLKGIRMQYLPQSIWRKSDKDRAAAMIHANDKRLKTRRIMRSLERFVRGRLTSGCYKGPYDLSYAAPIFQEVKLVQFYLVNMYIILVDYLVIVSSV
nr:hypothetical protein [Tanacetum cinerariifolium]